MGNHFDELAKRMAGGMSRREALRRLGGGLAGALLASLGFGRAWGQGFLQGCGVECKIATDFDPKTPGHTGTKAAYDACVAACADCKAHRGNVCRINANGSVECCTFGSQVCVSSGDELNTPRSCGATPGSACTSNAQCCRREVCYQGYCCLPDLSICFATPCPA
jgi:hypothetical protein